jgi:hypothetical protein
MQQLLQPMGKKNHLVSLFLGHVKRKTVKLTSSVAPVGFFAVAFFSAVFFSGSAFLLVFLGAVAFFSLAFFLGAC